MLSLDNPTIELAEKKVKILRASVANLRKESVMARKGRLKKLYDWINDNQDAIEEVLHADMRRPKTESLIIEVFPVLTELKHAIKHIQSWARPTSVSSPLSYFGSKAKILYEPKGLSLIISPWNYPFSLAIGPLISALAAGNAVLLKPSEFTPKTSALIGKMIGECFSSEVVDWIEGDAEVSKALVNMPFDHIFFTGSPATGALIMESAAKNLTEVTLELGGKSPAVIHASAPIDKTAERIVWGKFMNNGQTCVAPDYILVHESKKLDLVEAIKNSIKSQFSVGRKGIFESKHYSRIIHKKHFQRLKSMFEEAIENGARVLEGGDFIEDELFISPTVMDRVSPDSQLHKEEIFGPILPIYTYTTLHEVEDFVAQFPKPLAFYVFSSDEGFSKSLAGSCPAGTWVDNDCVLQFSHPNLPFGGSNHSGIGKAHGHFGFLAFSNQKAYLQQRWGKSALSVFYPPYGLKNRKFVQWAMKYLK